MRNTVLLCRLFAIVSVACTVQAAPAPAGLLVHRSGDQIAFSEAYSLLINGKDKALKAGREPNIAGPINKLPNERPNGTLLLDGKIGGLVEAGDDGSVQYLVPSGIAKNAAPDLKALWAGVQVSFKPSPSEKTISYAFMISQISSKRS